MTSRRSQVKEIPEWLRKLPGDARLRRTEVASILGYCSSESLTSAIEEGRWPELKEVEELRLRRSVEADLQFRRALYKVSDIRNLLRKLIRENQIT